MRLKAKEKLGFYPLAETEARRVRKYLQFSTESASILDPCAGTGAALCVLSEGAAARRYGIELDAYRAEQARMRASSISPEAIANSRCFTLPSPDTFPVIATL